MRTRFILSATLAVFALGLSTQRLQAQAGGSVCKDGTTSATTGKGACSGHGGVDAKATTAAKKAASASKSAAAKTTPAVTPPAKTAPATTAPAASKTVPATKTAPAATKTASASDKDATDATASCKDGTYSHAKTHKGACSNHGGVAKFLKP